MEILLYCAAAFTVGFILSWILKKPAGNPSLREEEELRHYRNQAPKQAEELTAYRIRIATQQQEIAGYSTRLEQLTAQIDLRHSELQQSGSRVVELTTRLETTQKDLATKNAELQTFSEAHHQTARQLQQSEKEVYALQLKLKVSSEQLELQKTELANIGDKFSREFEDLARKVLDEKTAKFDKHQEKSLSDILTPLKENIVQFKNEFESRYSRESEDRISLREQIRHMMDLNQTLSTQANNLTNALRGQVKQQGNWGEMILESILEYADLQKGIHYFVQEYTAGEDGQALYPDIIVRYPDECSIVIDSKVSLLNYEQYISATDPDTQAAALKSLINSVYRHIDGLSGKKYQDAVGSLDFVLLFVPVEGAYITIMQADRDLAQYAYRKRVLLMSSTNLIAAMKLVYDMWKRESISQNAQEIADKAVKIYEKLSSFVEDFEKVGAQMEKAGATYREAQKKLYTGRGNVISQASQMKQKLSHNKPARVIPSHLEEQGLLEDQQPLDDAEA